MNKYISVMAEVKLRTIVIDTLLYGKTTTGYKASDIETLGLQFRKMFELIAFASLAFHKKLYSEVYADFAKHWEAAKLIKRLLQINADFYPKPVFQVHSEVPGIRHNLVPRGADYLTENDLTIAHGRCGSLMHAANPYGREIDYGFYETAFPQWRPRIVNLLSIHQVRLLGDTGFYLIQMGSEDERPSWTPFARRDSLSDAETSGKTLKS